MPNEPITYTIHALSDILNVPKDRRAAMFADLALWLECAEAVKAGKLADIGGVELTTFKWTDDGISGINSIFICTPDGNGIIRCDLKDLL